MTKQEAVNAVKVDPRNPQGWLNLGAILAAEGSVGEARECYQRALLLDPSSEEAQAALALFESRAGPPEKMPDWLQQLRHRVEEDPSDASADEIADIEFSPERPSTGAEAVSAPLPDSEADESESGEREPDAEVPDAEVPDAEVPDWVHDVRERIGNDPIPPPPPRSRINRRRLILVLLVLTGLLLLTSAGGIWLLGRSGDGGSSSAGSAPSDEAVAATRLVTTPSPSLTQVPTWTATPTGTALPSRTPRPTRTPRPAATRTLEPTAAAAQAYRAFLEEVGRQYTPGVQQITILAASALEQSRLLDDNEWRLELATNIALIEYVSRQVYDYPVPARYAEYHGQLVGAAQAYDAAMGLFDETLDTRDRQTLAEAQIRLGEATRLINGLSPDQLP